MARQAGPDAALQTSRARQTPPSVDRRGNPRLTELGLMALAWIITAAFYALASLGSQGKMPRSIHMVPRRHRRDLATHALRDSALGAVLLAGAAADRDIAQWHRLRRDRPVESRPSPATSRCGSSSARSASSPRLMVVRTNPDLDRYRYMTLRRGNRDCCCCRSFHTSVRIMNGARLWIEVRSILLPARGVRQDSARLLLRLVLRRQPRAALHADPEAGRSHSSCHPRCCCRFSSRGGCPWPSSAAENDIGFALLLFALFISLLWVSPDSRRTWCWAWGCLSAGLYLRQACSVRFTLAYRSGSIPGRSVPMVG